MAESNFSPEDVAVTVDETVPERTKLLASTFSSTLRDISREPFEGQRYTIAEDLITGEGLRIVVKGNVNTLGFSLKDTSSGEEFETEEQLAKLVSKPWFESQAAKILYELSTHRFARPLTQGTLRQIYELGLVSQGKLDATTDTMVKYCVVQNDQTKEFRLVKQITETMELPPIPRGKSFVEFNVSFNPLYGERVHDSGGSKIEAASIWLLEQPTTKPVVLVDAPNKSSGDPAIYDDPSAEVVKEVSREIDKAVGEYQGALIMSMGAKLADDVDPNYFDRMTAFLERRVEEGKVVMFGSTASKIAEPIMRVLKHVRAKTIGIVPAGTVAFPGYSIANSDAKWPAAILPVDFTLGVGKNPEFDGTESSWFVQVARYLSEEKPADILMLNGGPIAILNEMSELFRMEVERAQQGAELKSRFILMKDAGRGSALFSRLIDRQGEQVLSQEELVTELRKALDEKGNQLNAKVIEQLQGVTGSELEELRSVFTLLVELQREVLSYPKDSKELKSCNALINELRDPKSTHGFAKLMPLYRRYIEAHGKVIQATIEDLQTL